MCWSICSIIFEGNRVSRQAILTLVLVIVILTHIASTAVVVAQTEKIYVAEVLPAPIGYSLTFQKPYPSYITGYRDVGGHYHSYRAAIGETGVLVFVNDRVNIIDKLVSAAETASVKLINVVDLNKVYGLLLPDSEDVIIYGSGVVYISHYNILYTYVPPGDTPSPTLLVSEYIVNFNTSKKYSLALSVASSTASITVITKEGIRISTRLSVLLDTPEACVTWFQRLPPGVPWVGGIIMSPTCTKNIKVMKTYTYEGTPYAVIFSAQTKYGEINYVIMAEPTAQVLEEAGIITAVKVNPLLHIVPGLTLDNFYVYTAPSKNSRIARGEVLQVIDATQLIDVKKEKRYACIIPSGAEVLYKVLWRNRDIKGTVYLDPGEALLFTVANKNYFCHGDLSWIKNNDMPIIRAPAFREIVHPIIMYTISGRNFLVLTANGKVYSTNSIELPFAEYQKNDVFIYAVNTIQPLYVSQTSIFLSPFFALALVFVMVVVGLIVFGRKGKEPEKIRIILDLPKPKAMTTASRETVAEVVRKHVDLFGVCPDVLDIAIYHSVLPPLPDKIGSPLEEIILCPFETNQRSEYVLRRVSDVLLPSLWAIRRAGRSHGYLYTLVGNTMLYMYWYKHEDEKKPEELLINAIEAAYRTRFTYPYNPLPLGLLIVVEDELVPALKKELELMRVLSGTEESKGGYAISSYISIKRVEVSIAPDKLQSFINEKVPSILIVSDKNIPELIEYLGERLTAYSELYYKRLRGET